MPRALRTTIAAASAALLTTALTAALATSSASAASHSTVGGAARQAILAQPHPYLRHACDGPLSVYAATTTQVAGHRVIVAETGCRNGTAGSPLETSAYAGTGKRTHRLYYLDRGKPRRWGAHRQLWVTPTSFTVRGTVVRLTYGGYAPADAMCCPSHLYTRTDRLTRTHDVPGRFRHA